MTSKGKQLEALIAFVEKSLLPHGFEVKTNEKVYDADGVQIAEFDIEIRGKVGSTNFTWLIECRDRPSDGPAPGAWIEQLVGRRTRFGFNKVTAVSTMGFAPGAITFARSEGIELREVKALSPDEFDSWLAIRFHHHIEKITALRHASIQVNEQETEERKHVLLEILSNAPDNPAFLKSSKTGKYSTPAEAFSYAVGSNDSLFDDLAMNGPGKNVRLYVQYNNDDDHFVVETSRGLIRVTAIHFEGEISIKETLVPLAVTAEYRHADSEQPISQVASFVAQEMHGIKLSLEVHRMAESGEMYVILRKV